MKILQINSVCGNQSTGRIVADLYRLGEQHGYDSLVAYGEGVSPEDINTYKIGNECSRYFHAVLSRLFDMHGFASNLATKKLIARIKEYQPDIIHLHNIHGYYLNIEILFNYIASIEIPIVWTLHDCWAFTGHCAYFDYVGCDKWKTGCYSCEQGKTYPATLFLDRSKKNFAKKKKLLDSIRHMIIITPSHWLASLVNQSFLKNKTVQVIHNGIDTNLFHPTPSRIRETRKLHNNIVVLGVANPWSERKGFAAFIQLARKLPNNYKIVLVGISKAQLKEIPDNIIGIPKVNNIEELNAYYTMADVFVNPTLEDNFPTTNLEALSCGTPVITYKTGGSVESVNPDTGYIVEKGNINQLVLSIEEFAKKGKKYYSDKCREHAVRFYNKKDRFTEYLQLYSMLNEKRR